MTTIDTVLKILDDEGKVKWIIVNNQDTRAIEFYEVKKIMALDDISNLLGKEPIGSIISKMQKK